MSGVSNTGPLREVLRAAVIEHGLTTDKIAENARGLRGRSWLQEKQTEQWREQLLTDDELAALAAGYRVPKERLRRADLDGHGLEIRGDTRQVWLFEEEAAGLTERQREAVRVMIAAMRDTTEIPAQPATRRGNVTRLQPGTGQRAARRGTNLGKRLREEIDRQIEAPPSVPEDEP